jgi:hypothetical protein
MRIRSVKGATVGRFVSVISLGLVAASGCGNVTANTGRPTTDRVLLCSVSRQECQAESSDGSTCQTFSPTPATFQATACGAKGADPAGVCHSTFCNTPAGAKYGYTNCTATGTDITDAPGLTPSLNPEIGVCSLTTVDNSQRTAFVTYNQRSRTCVLAPNNLSCASFNVVTLESDSSGCQDLSNLAAIDANQPNGKSVRDPSDNIKSVVVNAPQCPLYGSTSNATSALTAGNIGTVTASGTSTPVNLTSGFATIGTFCDPVCTPSIDRFQANLANVTVSGNTVQNVVVRNVNPIVLPGIGDPDSGDQTVGVGGVSLALQGLVNGVPSFFVTSNTDPWIANINGGNFKLHGPLNLQVTDANGHQVAVSMNVNVNGTPATAQQQSCAGLSPIARLFGFEDPLSWSATNATLSLVTSPVTQGCGALGISGQGYIPINGASFPTSSISPNNALKVDLFIPSNQPNPFYLGALQMYQSCPSGNVFNQYIGQVELTGKPQNQFSTLRFPLPAATLSTLHQSLSDCAFSFALNVNQTNRNWILDNLRFAN